ncbi:MAG TPA: acyl-CoA dehydrogenase family protein, partial [Acidimicrobiia bacterium]|nr:acyl-CoA dehydrogenase family protein [Acidimicrobiia bacterium]
MSRAQVGRLTEAAQVIASARRLADELLFPAASMVDAAETVPVGHLNTLAALGFYGLTGPTEAGGLGMEGPAAWRTIEELAGGCLTTTFVWLQHLGVVQALSKAAPHMQERLVPMCGGRVRAGIALGGVRPEPTLRAELSDTGWVLDGYSPWVTGWGLIDVVHVAARTRDDQVLWCLLDAVPAASVAVHHLRLAAVNASSTVTLDFDRFPVPEDRITFIFPYSQWQEIDSMGLRPNGSLSLGLTGRCCRLLGPGYLDDELGQLRQDLDGADPGELPRLRAAAAEMALRAAAAVVTASGS